MQTILQPARGTREASWSAAAPRHFRVVMGGRKSNARLVENLRTARKAPEHPAPYPDRGEHFRFCRGATTEGSRGLQPTVEDESRRRRGATREVLMSATAQASLRDARSVRGLPWAEAHGYRPLVAPRPSSEALRVWSRAHRPTPKPSESLNGSSSSWLSCLLLRCQPSIH